MNRDSPHAGIGFGNEPFDPYELRPLATLNSRRVASVPGGAAEWSGHTGWELLSRHALVGLIQSRELELGLGNELPHDLPVHLNELLISSEGAVRAAAVSIAECYGRRLGSLIAALLNPSPGLTSPMVAWEREYLQHWQERVSEIVLGGGLANGRFGQLAGEAARRTLAGCGLGGRRISVAANPSFLPLIGAARCAPAGPQGQVAVLDFGGTRVKRGLAFTDGDQSLRGLRALPVRGMAKATSSGDPAELARSMVAAIAETIGEADPNLSLAPLVVCSVASYVQEGRPMRIERGAYTSLHLVSRDILKWFSREVSRASGRALQVVFRRDADVAGCAFAGRMGAAVIMLGSSLGAGFAPPAAGYRTIADAFTVEMDGDWT